MVWLKTGSGSSLLVQQEQMGEQGVRSRKMVGFSFHYLIPEGDRRLPPAGDYFCVGAKKIATGSVQHGFIFDFPFRSSR